MSDNLKVTREELKKGCGKSWNALNNQRVKSYWCKPYHLCQICKAKLEGYQKAKKEIENKKIVNFYKGKDVTEADRLLFDTAQNNFKAGQKSQREEELKFLKSLTWFNMNKKVRLRIDKRIKELEMKNKNG